MSIIEFNNTNWNSDITPEQQEQAIHALEQGNVLLFPQLYQALSIQERELLNPKWLAPKSKNISLRPGVQKIDGALGTTATQAALLRLCQHYADNATKLVHMLFPTYRNSLIQGRTSFRPAPVNQRKLSPRQDDKRLHVDAFPSSPNQGKRILRVFCNINLNDVPRVWRLGESFADVAKQFLPQIKAPFPGSAILLKVLGITKTKRSLYDHYMLHIHDNMKMDEAYQQSVAYEEVKLPALSTWVVFTDQVSHAAMSGQFMLEQTFYLPPDAMQDPSLAPINIIKALTAA